jgi:predicted DsbA family dithiol-disulfide isomerase
MRQESRVTHGRQPFSNNTWLPHRCRPGVQTGFLVKAERSRCRRVKLSTRANCRVRSALRRSVGAAHPQALKAHEAVHCAAEQGKRREMHKKVVANQRALSISDLSAHAVALGLEKTRFEKCLADGAQATKVRSGMAAGEQAGVRGTPTFFVGLTEPNSAKLKAVRRIVGAPYNAFKAAIDELLSNQ